MTLGALPSSLKRGSVTSVTVTIVDDEGTTSTPGNDDGRSVLVFLGAYGGAAVGNT